MEAKTQSNNSNSEWVAITRYLGVIFGVLILFAHYAFPNTDPSPTLSEWMLNEFPKLLLAGLLIVPWSRISNQPWWLFCFGVLVLCAAAFLVRIIGAMIIQLELSQPISDLIVGLAIDIVMGGLVILQVIAILKLRPK